MRRAFIWLTALLVIPVLAALGGSAPLRPPAAGQDDEKLLKDAKVGVDGPSLLDYFRRRTTPPSQQEHIIALIRQLGADSFNVRRTAAADLAALGPRALPYLRRALNDPDEEIKDRVELLLKNAPSTDALAAQAAAAARLIRIRAPENAAAVLLSYLPDADNDAAEDEALASLAILAVHDGKVDPLITAALKDKQASRRAAASFVMGRSGAPEQRDEIHGLRLDADQRVRFRAAQGLLAARDRAALPALVNLVKDGPTDLAYRGYDELLKHAPTRLSHVPFAEDQPTRQNCIRSWENWLARYGKTADLNHDAVDLAPFNPALRAREVVRQCFNAMVQSDLVGFKKTAGLPFHFGGEPTYTKAEDLDRFFNQRPLGVQGQPWAALIVGTASLEEYQGNGAQENERQFIKALRQKAEVLVFIVQPQQLGASNPSPDFNQGNLFLVWLGGEQPFVIGLSQGRSGFRVNR